VKRPPATRKTGEGDTSGRVDEVVAWIRRTGTKKTRDGMARYAIPSDKAFGVPMSVMRGQAKKLGKDHALALGLWETGWYEARMMAALLGDPELVTPAQMDKWCRQFEDWAICDTVCFFLFDKTPYSFRKIRQWSKLQAEFPKRGAFALLASVALHNKASEDREFLECLPLVEAGAQDDRNFVKKGVSWALRAIATRNPNLKAAATELAQRLAESPKAAPRWVGKDALREFSRKKKR
jgi:3-methyladenine DNA glycosylase AlkD